MQFIDRRLGFRVVWHLDKAKAAGPARITVGRYAGLLDSAKGLEELRQVLFGRCPGQIADKDIHGALLPYASLVDACVSITAGVFSPCP
jgi:hypothetical protein